MTLLGVNLPTLGPDYDHDLAPNERHPHGPVSFSPMAAHRHLAMARQLGFGAVRIWLCENREGLRTDGSGVVDKVHPDLLHAVEVIQEEARALGLRLYWSLLDGNAWLRNGDEVTGAALASPLAAAALARAAHPLLERLDPDLTVGLELVNEPESASAELHPERGLAWETLAASLEVLGEELRAVSPWLTLTAGTQAAFLPGLLCGGRVVDAIDLHVVHPDGGLPSREDLPSGVGDLPLWVGEAGLHPDAPAAVHVLEHYLHNARRLGYGAVFLWKLEGELASARLDERGARVFDPTAAGASLQRLLRKWRESEG